MSGQNTSTAVMQRRRPTPPGALEYFPTQPWAVRAVCEFLIGLGEPLGSLDCWEPTCGEGFMARPLDEYFRRVRATDVFRYGPDHGICDFLAAPSDMFASWVFMNPPFRPAQRFIAQGLDRAKRGLCVILRTAILEGGDRYEGLFEQFPPSYALIFTERVVMLEGRLIKANAPDPFNLDPDTGQPRKASSATSYCCLIWIHGQSDTRLRLTGRVREKLERESDYPDYAEQWAKIASHTGGGLL